MVLTTVLDTVLGVVFVFLVFSLFVSGAGEGIGRVVAWRQRHLWRWLRRFVDGDEGAWNKDQRPRRERTSATLTDRLYDHPLIRQLEGRNATKRTRVARIATSDFSRAVVDVLAPVEGGNRLATLASQLDDLPVNSALKAHLRSVLSEANVTLDRVQAEIGGWFDTRMQWLSELYKRHMKALLMGIAIVIVVFSNVDAVRVATEFYRDDALRSAVTQQAVSLVDACAPPARSGGGDAGTTGATGLSPSPEPADAQQLQDCLGEEVKKVTDEIRLPVGWPDPGRPWFMRALGWLIAAIAVSQGAPFWFDVLRRVSTFRKQ